MMIVLDVCVCVCVCVCVLFKQVQVTYVLFIVEINRMSDEQRSFSILKVVSTS